MVQMVLYLPSLLVQQGAGLVRVPVPVKSLLGHWTWGPYQLQRLPPGQDVRVAGAQRLPLPRIWVGGPPQSGD